MMPATIHFYDAHFIGNPTAGQLVSFDSAVCTGTSTVQEDWKIRLRPDVSFRPKSIEQSDCFDTDLSAGITEYDWSRIAEGLFSRPDTLHVGVGNTGIVDNYIRSAMYRSLSVLPNTRIPDGNCYLDLNTTYRAMSLLRPDALENPLSSERSESQIRSLVMAGSCESSRALAVKEFAQKLATANQSLFNHSVKLSSPDRIADFMGLVGGNIERLEQLRPVFLCHETLSTPRRFGIYQAIGADPMYAGVVYMVDLACDIGALLKTGSVTPSDFLRRAAADTTSPIVRVNLNRVPFVCSLKMIAGATAQRLGLDLDAAHARAEILRTNHELTLAFTELSIANDVTMNADPDSQLLSVEYLDSDLALIAELHRTSMSNWPDLLKGAHDSRIPALAKRLVGRYSPTLLEGTERNKWLAHCAKRLLGSGDSHSIESDRIYCQELSSNQSAPSGMRSGAAHWLLTTEIQNE